MIDIERKRKAMTFGVYHNSSILTMCRIDPMMAMVLTKAGKRLIVFIKKFKTGGNIWYFAYDIIN